MLFELQSILILDLLLDQIYVSPKVKDKAGTSNSSPRRIIRDVTAEMNKTSAVEMGTYATLSRNVRSVRQKTRITPKLPESISELVITDPYTLITKGEKFLIFDNKNNENRMLMFTTRDNLQSDFFKQATEGKPDIDVGVQEMLDYMERNWVEMKVRRKYKPGTFNLKLWNVYQLTLDMLPRTKNAVEAWHNAI